MPIVVTQRRTEVKCYLWALFTCMAIRAIHIEVVFKLNTDSFILALRRLIAKGGNEDQSILTMEVISLVLKENWGRHILRWMALESFMEGIGGNWIKWHKNSSFASYMGRVFEWQICLAHTILASMLKMHGKSPDDDEWWWLKDNESKVEGIQNPWPLTVEMINDHGSFQPLSSVDILIMMPKVVMLLPDSYCRRCWGWYST